MYKKKTVGICPRSGTIGHVAHGKSTVVKAISGVHTVRFKNELERNITIKLGYANAKVRALVKPYCYVLIREAFIKPCVWMFMKRYRCISWMIPAAPDQSATGRVAAALLMSFPQISLVPRAASNWSGETAKTKARQLPRCRLLYLTFIWFSLSQTRVFCWLSWSRHFDGNHVERSCCHGCSPPAYWYMSDF